MNKTTFNYQRHPKIVLWRETYWKRTALTLVMTALAIATSWGAMTGSGTQNDPYIIHNSDDISVLSWYMSTDELRDQFIRAYYKLADNFDNSNNPTSYSIGTNLAPFEGHFDGNGRTLYVNTIVADGIMGAAPFEAVKGATIENLNVAGTVNGKGYHASGLVGIITGGTVTIRNCNVSATVYDNAYAGGFVGHAGSHKLIMENCVFSGVISGFANYAGGLLGWCEDLTLTMTNCLFKGTFSGTGKYHPVGVKYHPKTVNATVTNVYYLNTITPTVTGNNLIPGADGTPVSQTRIPGEWTVAVVAADGNTYYLPGTYANVTFAEGTKDLENWSISPETPEDIGATVTLAYSGSKKVKSVSVGIPCNGDLTNIKKHVYVPDGATLTGTYSHWGKITIADRAIVTLQDFTISSWNWEMCPWAGINCEGDAIIILKGTNYVKGYHHYYPGIHVPEGHTLTIRGNGTLEVLSNGYGAGIGGGNELSCGNIRIEGGTITARGGIRAAAVGGGENAACGDLTFTGGITSLTAIKDEYSPYSIGPGENGTCGTITVGKDVMDPIVESCTLKGSSGGSDDDPTESYERATFYIPVEVTPCENGNTWTFVMPQNDVQVSVDYASFDVAFAEDTEDVENWSIVPDNPVDVGSTVTLSYAGTRQVESVMAESTWNGNLPDLWWDVTVADGMTLTGKFDYWKKISIADGATVTLQDASIEGRNWAICEYAGISCLGDATLILKGTNYVKGFHYNYPAIYVPEGHTLTIIGDGSLEVISNGSGAGIGGGQNISCGNIVIKGGTIKATGRGYSAAIGGGYNAACGDITITDGVVSVTAIKEGSAPYTIGPGNNGTCGTITIGGVVTDPINNDYTYEGTGNGSETVPEPMEKPCVVLPIEVKPSETPGIWTFTMRNAAATVSVNYVIPTGIEKTEQSPLSKEQTDRWYMPDGRRLNTKPTAKGVYINGGKTVIIK